MKKVLFALFPIGLICLYILYQFFELQDSSIYLFTCLLTLLGVGLYPISKNFTTVQDFLFLPLAVFFIFSIINLIWIGSYQDSLSILNVLFGCFGFAQYYLTRRKVKQPSKNS